MEKAGILRMSRRAGLAAGLLASLSFGVVQADTAPTEKVVTTDKGTEQDRLDIQAAAASNAVINLCLNELATEGVDICGEVPTTTTTPETTLPPTTTTTIPPTTTTTAPPPPPPPPEPAPAPEPITGAPAGWMAAAGIAPDDQDEVDYIMTRESGWNPGAVNGGGCIGLGQNCPDANGNLWLEDACPDWQNDPVCQLDRFEEYAFGRYGSWQAAAAHSRSEGWW